MKTQNNRPIPKNTRKKRLPRIRPPTPVVLLKVMPIWPTGLPIIVLQLYRKPNSWLNAEPPERGHVHGTSRRKLELSRDDLRTNHFQSPAWVLFVQDLNMRNYSNFIGGEWVAAKSGQTFKNLNPADTREFVAEYPLSGKEDAAAAITAAKAAFPAWAATTPPARGRILSKTSQILEGRKAELAE